MLKVETWPIERCIPYARNPRKNDAQVDRMVSAIKEFGFRIPVVAKSDGSVVDGHLRLKAAQKLGLKEVPVALADELNEAQVKAFRLLANKSANWAEWDDELLKLELEELKGLDYDLQLTGFDSVELDDVFASATGGTEGLTDADDCPEVQETPVTKEGDIWLLGKHRLMCGDSTCMTDVDALLQGIKIDAVVTDPPYGLEGSKTPKNNYDVYQDTKANLEQLIKDVMPICQSLAPVVVLTPGNKNHWLYPKPDWEMAWFIPAGGGIGPWGFVCWQPILCYGKDPKLAKGKGSHPDAIVHQEIIKDIKWHPCAKPVNFWKWLVERCTEEGETLFEPFSGAGTTLIVCEKTGRICNAMELSPQYVDCSVRRWQDFTGQKATLESNGKTFDEVANV